MNRATTLSLAFCAATLGGQAFAQVVLYEDENFGGRSFTAERAVGDFDRTGFNDRASSAVVLGDRWEACDDARFKGRCIVLQPGRYPSLAAMGMNDRMSSLRPLGAAERVDSSRYAPAPAPVYDNHRRRGERLFEANVTSVRAVVAQSGRRCWTERERVAQRGDVNVPGAIAGALIGGVLGHQIGNGRGNDAATAGGAIVGGVVGANAGRGDSGSQYRDVERCSDVQGEVQPEYWDVTYEFRGLEHRVQMVGPPGATITVNEQGEPRA